MYALGRRIGKGYAQVYEFVVYLYWRGHLLVSRRNRGNSFDGIAIDA